MTREEEICIKAHMYDLECATNSIVEAFIAGAEWADQPSPWISVEERMPENNGKYYVIVCGEPDMAIFKNGKWVTAYKERRNTGSHIGIYNDAVGDKDIEIQDFEFSHTDLTADLTHWMQIPELKGGEQ